MNEEEKEDLQDIIDDINRDVQNSSVQPENSREKYSKSYQKYKEEEKESKETSRYERFCYKSASILNLKADQGTREKLNPAIKLVGWEITPGMVLSASVITGGIAFFGWMMLFILNSAFGLFPNSLLFISLIGVIGSGVYMYYKPIFEAKNKVIRSSGEMILSILYMVIYMRSSPNLEGAVRFAALNLEGPISEDLKSVLWDVEVGKFNRVEESLENYTKAWKDYNEDYLESLQLLKAAVNEPNNDRREDLLQDSIDRILDGTQEKMKHYAQGLKTPVMILNALGALLPVLAMIMLPLISVFMGSAISPFQLFLAFNVVLPGTLYWFMQKILSSRPPTVNSKPKSEEAMPERGKYSLNIMSKTVKVPSRIIGGGIFLLISSFGFLGYLAFPHFYPVQELEQLAVPALFGTSNGLSPFPMLLRSLSITAGLGFGIGATKILGNIERKKAEKEIEKIEKQLPSALFELGNEISGGTPIELALKDAADSTSQLEISKMFSKASDNIQTMGMTFEQAIFDDRNGALKEFPSQMLDTVMRAVLSSSEKGTKIASMAMLTVSKYLKNVHKTQERLNDLMEESTTTIQMLAYMLAPVVSGVAVGMSQTIISAMFNLGQQFADTRQSLPSQGSGAGFGGILGNLQTAIPPEVLQFVVGIYLIQLLFILGTFYTKIKHGENKTYKNMFIGKILISGFILYSITMIIVALLFGGIISNATA
ncbi:type II secretion system F family protein [Candidatus Nanohalobium constans]|uniref:Type II secretion system protein GspF domain-containing protein n=1 Tax=Candidatus Nanohalobium constans TaxID=2565781 RepID=A0A5Q0UGW0_9ARCH|nr:type II secretion system F family protein [Candidatus Nanohalobium constans]QGA80824.1 hypothetical protein LC1Nh_0942 [Candidatus Nanohalobium constans]